MSRGMATAIGFTAILMWGLLAFFSKLASPIPPLQLTAMSFLIGGLVGVASWIIRPGAHKELTRHNWRVWAHNVAGLFGSHLLYFIAIGNAPVVEVSLIAYLWPLFIVFFSSLLPGEKLRWNHLAGIALGLVGAWLVISKGQTFSFSNGLQLGHLIALPYALFWAGFSVSIRRYGAIPSDIVTGFCLASGVLAGLFHLGLETTLWPLSPMNGLAVLGLGLFPVGAAFYAWDFAMKHGDPMVLGAASYVAPLLSTLILLVAGMTQFHWSIAVACAFIVSGAILGAKDMLLKQA